MAERQFSLVHEVVQPDGIGPFPTLLLLHGRGADEHDLLPLAQSLDPRFMVISARAPHGRFGGYHWYDLLDLGVPEPASYAVGLQRLQQFVQEVLRTYPVAGDQLYLLGFSQGAMMSDSLLLTQPERVAAAVLLSGYLPLDQNLPVQTEQLAGKPVFIGHGTADRVLSVALGRRARDFLHQAGADLTYQEYAIAHQIGGQELQDVAAWLSAHLDG